LAGKEIVPEFIQHAAKPDAIAAGTLRLIDNQQARQKMMSDFDSIIRSLGGSGASENAAAAIIEEISR
jgi:lipid-A-disaccharide synthase